jgi:hypothetical protein
MNDFAYTGQAAAIEDDLVRLRRRKLEFDDDAARARREWTRAVTPRGRRRWQRMNRGGGDQRTGGG